PFAVIGERVVKAAADVDADGIRHRKACRGDRPAGHQAEALDDLARPRQLELANLLRAEAAVLRLREVLLRVDERELLPCRGLRIDPLPGAFRGQLAIELLVLGGRKNVRADVDSISRRADDAHAYWRRGCSRRSVL